jgi:hypothetical protein
MGKPLRVKFEGNQKYGEAYLGFAKKKLAQHGGIFTDEAGDEVWSRTIDLEDGGKIILMGGVEQDHITIIGPPREVPIAKLEVPEIYTPPIEIPKWVEPEFKREYELYRKKYIAANRTEPVEFYVGCLFRDGWEEGGYTDEYILLYKVDFSEAQVDVDLSKPDYKVKDRGIVPEGFITDLDQTVDKFHDGPEFQIWRLAEKQERMEWAEYTAHGIPVPPYNDVYLGNGCPETFVELDFYDLEYWLQWGPEKAYDPWVRQGLYGVNPGVTNNDYFYFFDKGYPQFSGGLLVRHCGLLTFTMYNHRMDNESIIEVANSDFQISMAAGQITHRPIWGAPGYVNYGWDGAGQDPYGQPPADLYEYEMDPSDTTYYERLREIWCEFSMTPAQGFTEPWYGGTVNKTKYPLIYGRANFFMGHGIVWDFIYPVEENIVETGAEPDNHYVNSPNPYGATPKSWMIGMGMYEDDTGTEQWGTTLMWFYEPSAAYGYSGPHFGWREMRDDFFGQVGGPCHRDQANLIVEERDKYGDAIQFECLYAQDHGEDPLTEDNDYIGLVKEEGHFVRVVDMFVKFPKTLTSGRDPDDRDSGVRIESEWEKYNQEWEIIND